MVKCLQILALMIMSLGAVGVTSAHSKLLSSKPAAGDVVGDAPDRIELVFSVRVQPGMCSITVTGRDGVNLSTGPLEASPDAKTIWVTNGSSLPPDEYKVEWRALSADDHLIRGNFSFRVLPQAEVTSSFAVPLPPSNPQDHTSMDHSMHAGTPSVNWPQIIVRWLAYLAMMVLTGGLAFRFFVGSFTHEAEARVAFDRRAGSIFIFAAALSLSASIAALFLQTSTVFDSVSMTSLIDILTETGYGPPWALQATAAALALALLLVARRMSKEDGTRWLWAAFAASLLVLVSPAMTGHARAASTEYRFAILSGWLHLAAAAVWVGGLVMLASAVPLSIAAAHDKIRTLSGFVSGFNKLAVASVLFITATGFYNSWIHVDGFDSLAGTAYGQVLFAKAAISVLIAVIGGVNVFIVHPRIVAAEAGAQALLARNVRIEVGLAAIVLLLAAVLAFLPPAREHLPVNAVSVAPALQGHL